MVAPAKCMYKPYSDFHKEKVKKAMQLALVLRPMTRPSPDFMCKFLGIYLYNNFN